MLNLRKMPYYRFPDGFLWGSATAGHQIEGDNFNSQNYRSELQHPEYYEEPSGKACNSWEMYPEDVELLHSLGHRAYRFSIEWSRIQPAENQFDTAALARYQDLLDRLASKGIHACVTLHHGTHPIWFEDLGGFRKEDNLHFFLDYLNYLVPKITDRVGSWIILNEFNLDRSLAPENLALKASRLKAHAFGYRLVKQYSNAPISSAHAFVHQCPLRPGDSMDQTMASLVDWVTNEFFFHAVRTGEIVLPYREMEYLPELKGASDRWMINYYHRAPIDARKVNGIGEKLEFARHRLCDIDFGQREFNPESFMQCAARLTDLPIWITENGICADDDRFRIIYMMLQFEAMKMAMQLYPVKIEAYLHWSLLDNYEWRSFKPRFGLVEVDRKTFRRTPKPSAKFLQEVCENNAFSGDLFAKYIPEFNDFIIYDGPNRSVDITI